MPEPSATPPAAPLAGSGAAPATPAAPTPAKRPGRPTGRRKWLYRLAAMTLVPLTLFGLLEMGLRAGGYGQNASFFIDGEKLEREGVVIENRDFGRSVFPRNYERLPFPVPVVMSKEKPANTFRVFVLGESAAMGFPEPSVSFPRVLEVLLQARYPDTKIEVVNAAMVAINSHIVLRIARECASYQPDLFVVHLGNNEVVGPFGAAGVIGPYSPSRTAIRASLATRRTRTGQLISSLIHRRKEGEAPKAWAGMKMFVDSQVSKDDPRLPRIYEHFRENLGDICEVGADARVPVVVCTIPVNLRESAPFASMHKPDLSPDQTTAWDAVLAEGNRLESAGNFAAAADKYAEAEKLDDQHADLEYRLGRMLLATGKAVEGRDRLLRARDLDALRFRSDAVINRTIREVVAGQGGKGVFLADAEATFDAASPPGGPGENVFLEHVHMNFSGNYLLARTVFDSIAPTIDARLKSSGAALTEQECADRLAYTPWNESKVFGQVVSDLFQQPPFTTQSDRVERAARWKARLQALQARLGPEGMQKVAAVYEKAVADRPEDWMLRMNYGLLLMELGQDANAEVQYRTVVKTHHHAFPARVKLANILFRMGRLDEAESRLREAMELAPDVPDIELALADLYGARGRVDDGVAIFEKHVATDSDRGQTLLAYGSFLFRAGRLDEAKKRLTEAVELKPDQAMPRAMLGDIALRQGRKAEALAHYEAALKIRPEWPELRAFVAKVQGDPVPK